MTCKYCTAPGLEWKQNLAGDWALMAPDGFRHQCPEYRAAKTSAPTAMKRKKAKTGAFLRWYGPKGARAEAVLVETRIGDDTPAAFYLEPTISSFDEVQAGRRWPK